ncbi:MAG TPA: hemolysin family protein [Gemmatimonadales bacterium]|jgi:CBS domain containing-hemolysin-like protein
MIWIAVVLGLVLTVFGATAGAAQMSVSKRQLAQTLSSRLRGRGPSLDWLMEADDRLTVAASTTSLGVILLAMALPGVIGSTFLLSLLGVALIALPVALAAGYLVPRWLTEPRSEAVLAAVMPVFRPWSRLVSLVLPSRQRSRHGELGAIWRETAAAGVDDNELMLIGGVMTFAERQVREVMTPRTEIVAVPEDSDLDDMRRVFLESGYSRIPVYRRTLDDIVGMLHAFDLFKLRAQAPLPIRPVTIAPASRNCGDLLLDMQRERRHLAVIIDEFGGTQGVVTLEDLLEELVGEIFDEHDESGPVPVVPPTGLLESDGSESVEAIGERFGVELPSGRATTFGGRISELAGRIPSPGERFMLSGLVVDVIQASPARIERMLVRLEGPPAQRLGGEA